MPAAETSLRSSSRALGTRLTSERRPFCPMLLIESTLGEHLRSRLSRADPASGSTGRRPPGLASALSEERTHPARRRGGRSGAGRQLSPRCRKCAARNSSSAPAVRFRARARNARKALRSKSTNRVVKIGHFALPCDAALQSLQALGLLEDWPADCTLSGELLSGERATRRDSDEKTDGRRHDAGLGQSWFRAGAGRPGWFWRGRTGRRRFRGSWFRRPWLWRGRRSWPRILGGIQGR